MSMQLPAILPTSSTDTGTRLEVLADLPGQGVYFAFAGGFAYGMLGRIRISLKRHATALP